jgi:hypothetical protein
MAGTDLVNLILGIMEIRNQAQRPRVTDEGVNAALDILDHYTKGAYNPPGGLIYGEDDPSLARRPPLTAGPSLLGELEERPGMSAEDALSNIYRHVPPGTPMGDTLEERLLDTRARARFQRNLEPFSKVLGIPIDELKSMGLDGVQQYLAVQRGMPMPRIAPERTTGEGGEALEQVTGRDPRTGEMLFRSKGGPAYSDYMDFEVGPDGELRYRGRVGHLERALQAKTGQDRAKRTTTGLQQRQQVKTFARSAAAVSKLVGEGTTPQGRLRKLGASAQSIVSHAGQGIRFMGVPLDNFVKSDPFPGLLATSVENAQLRHHELAMAAAVAAMMDPGNLDIERGQIKEALRYVSPIFKEGSAKSINAGLLELTKVLLARYADTNEDLIDAGDLKPLRLEDMPFLRRLGAKTVTLSDEELAELRKAGTEVGPSYLELKRIEEAGRAR